MFHKGMTMVVLLTIIISAVITSAIFLMMYNQMDFLTEGASKGSELLTPHIQTCDEVCKLHFGNSYSGECVIEGTGSVGGCPPENIVEADCPEDYTCCCS